MEEKGVILIKKRVLALILSVIFVIAVTGGYFLVTDKLLPSIADTPQPLDSDPGDESKDDQLKENKTKIILSATGDIMVHIPQYKAAYIKESDSYDFSENFGVVSEILQKADLTIGNLETVFAGKERKISGYPVFNSPDEMAFAIKDAGYDLLSTANNHSMDKGEAGVLRTLDLLEELSLTPVGTHRSADERARIVVKDVKGIKLAFLAYTFGTNGLSVPPGKDYLVNLANPEEIRADISRAKISGADLVIVSMHWGIEYKRQPNEQQKNLAKEIIAAGADLILGSHPHVIQPFEKLEVYSDTGEKKQGYIIYSLGNFISNQNLQTLNMKYVDSGVILTFEIEKDFNKNITQVTNVNYVPTWVHKFSKDGRNHYKILSVEDAIKTYEAGQKGDLTVGNYNRLKEVLGETREQFSVLNLVY